MNDARNTQPPHSTRLARGDSGGLCCVKSFSRGLVCVIVALSIALLPLDAHINSGLNNVSIQKSEAHANPAVIAGAGAALSALAVELGISEAALVAGICAVGVGATGLAFYNASRTDVALPGWKPWDDLTPQQKQDWVGQDGTSEDYYNQQIAWWALQAGILEQTPNGGLQPTPEPDPSNDPNGHSNWQKARNVLIALAAGGGAVAFNEAVGPLVDNASSSIKELLFGGSNVPGGSLELNYVSNYDISGAQIRFITMPGGVFNPTNKPLDQVYVNNIWTTNDWYWYFTYSEEWTDKPGPKFAKLDNPYQVIDMTLLSDGGIYYWQTPTVSNSYAGTIFYVYDNAVWSTSWTNIPSRAVPNSNGSTIKYTMLNANFAGTYRFGSSAEYSGGLMSGNGVTLNNIDYGQMSDTPTGLEQNILNPTYLTQFYNTFTNDTPSDYKRALTVPTNFNDPNYVPQYSDFVKVTPDEDITNIPGNEQLPSPGPDNPPTPDDQYQQDFGQTVGQLLSQPFNQLFPFCLIGDLYTLTQKIESAVYPSGDLSTQDVLIINGTSELVIPLDDFGVTGMDDIELDLTPIVQFGNMVRPWTTAIFIVFLLVGTFRFFLNRGGE